MISWKKIISGSLQVEPRIVIPILKFCMEHHFQENIVPITIQDGVYTLDLKFNNITSLPTSER